MTRRAATLDETLDVLELLPLDFGGTDSGQPRDPAADPAFYVEPPAEGANEDALPAPSLAETLAGRLLGPRHGTCLFLSGHVGSGKSTQLSKLAANPGVRDAFSVVPLRIEAEYVAVLDTPLLLLLLSGAIHDFGHTQGLLSNGAAWRSILLDFNARVLGESSPVGGTSIEVNALIFKLRQELKFSEHRRRLLREVGETQHSLLVALLRSLTEDVATALVKRGSGRSLLLLVDDLDKVRSLPQQKELFDQNLSFLLNVPFHVLYTLPTGVVFGPNRVDVRRSLEHLYPMRVLDKSPKSFDPERAFLPGSDGFFRQAVDRRVEPRLFDDAAVRLAAIYSGGVLREFFRLLRTAVRLALHNKLDTVSAQAVRGAVRDERRRESLGLLTPDYGALRAIHETHGLATDEDRRYLDEGRVLECYNDKTWYEVTPLLWKLLEPRE